LPPPTLARVLESARNVLDALRRTLAPPAVVVIEMTTGYFISQALYVAARLGIAELLKDGPRDAASLATTAGCDANALYRLLRCLASVGVFRERADGRFELTPTAATLQRDHAQSTRDMVLMNGMAPHWKPWGELLECIQSGESSFERIYGMPLFEYLDRVPDEGRVFDGAMANLTNLCAAAALGTFDFKSANTIVDVGGGNGRLIGNILRSCPHLKGILFDRPDVVANATEMLDAYGVADRCETVGGNFFETAPKGGDIYVLKNVIHDWDDEVSRRILCNVHAAMPAHGRLLLIEMVIPPGNTPMFGKLMDLEMLVFLNGRERTASEFNALLQHSGFRLVRIQPTALPISLIEAVRK
jgi:hypothetical protein